MLRGFGGIGIEVDFVDRVPIACSCGPSVRIGLSGSSVNILALCKHWRIKPCVALSWGYKTNGAVPVLGVVPMDQICHPAARMHDVGKGPQR